MKIFAIILCVFVTIFVVGCTSSGLKPRTVEQYYVSSGIEKYFLSDLPEWANFSPTARCFRNGGIRYFDLQALMKSYSLKYADALQMQATFNEEFLQLKKDQKSSQVNLKDEEHIFFKASDKVNSKIVFFDPPAFKQVHLIWLDEALLGKKEEERLKRFMSSSVHDNGFPVLISMCLTKEEAQARFPDFSSKVISAELFSIYDEKGERKPSLHMNVNAFFKPEQKIIFFTQNKKTLEEIRGNYKASTY